MEWLSKLAYERSRTELVGKAAESYWAMFKAMVDAARNEFNRLYPPAANHEQAEYQLVNANQIVLKRAGEDAQVPPQFTVVKSQVTVTFQPEVKPPKITAIYSTPQAAVTLTVAQGLNGYAVIRQDDHDLTLDEACELILGPVLFG